jgi:2-polyprenyl-6-methoxyphenol hydroxylase-like FAD-dependent oxidoreductase
MGRDETAGVDVAIVGYGPVGQALAGWLGAAGHRVACFERYEEIYRLPRAVHLDHEVMRLLQRLGVAGELAQEMLSVSEYHWYGADGETLMVLRPQNPALSGWEPDWLFFQPTLEQALDARARANEGVTVERGWIAEGLSQDADGAAVALRRVDADASGQRGEPRIVRARYVIGADGANSFVREALGIPSKDLGFQEEWLVADVVPVDPEALDLPTACQWCDPHRPTTHVRSGVGHRRWEFMLLPGERAEDFDRRRTWRLLAPWFTPRDGELLRHSVYRFRSTVAERMRDRRVLIAGDAAHLTPPFLGQGMCVGLRDAANIAWKLDLVLRGVAREELLDTVAPERQAQNEWVIAFAVELGKVLCELDHEKAAERDRTLRGAGPPPDIALPPLQGGALRDGDPLAGHLSLQGRMEIDGREGLLDDLVGGGFTLLCRDRGTLGALDGSHRALLERLDVSVVALGADAGDLDGRTSAWLDDNGAAAVLVRPDLYVYGSAGSPAQLPRLLEEVAEQLGISRGPLREQAAPVAQTARC